MKSGSTDIEVIVSELEAAYKLLHSAGKRLRASDAHVIAGMIGGALVIVTYAIESLGGEFDGDDEPEDAPS